MMLLIIINNKNNQLNKNYLLENTKIKILNISKYQKISHVLSWALFSILMFSSDSYFYSYFYIETPFDSSSKT